MNARAVAAVLAQLPGVRNAEVDRGEAYIVPDDEYLHRERASPVDEAHQVEQWRRIYDLYEKGKIEPTRELGLSWSLWKSSYTQAPIDPEQLREWCDLTVDRIKALGPRDVFEIGCGTGAIAMRVAPACRRYVAVDVSAASLYSLGRQMETTPGEWSGVSLLQREADDIGDVDAASFDTVVANSVIQYFPSVEYLERVIGALVRLAKPGGAVFIGDVRSLELFPAFAASIELHAAKPNLGLGDLRRLLGRRLLHDRELVLSPAFFLGFGRRHPRVANVEILPKLGSGDNELINYRYDVTLRIGGDEPLPEIAPAWRDWTGEELTIETLREILEPRRVDTIGIRGVPNARVITDVSAVERFFSTAESVERLLSELDTPNHRSSTPAAFSRLAGKTGYEVHVSWASCRPDGSFDAVFRRRDRDQASPSARIVWPEIEAGDQQRPSSSDPPCRAGRRQLIRDLEEHARKHLLPDERPTSFTLVRELPARAAANDRSRATLLLG